MQNTLKCSEVLALPYECWRWYDGFEGIAQVSTMGRVQTVDRWVTYSNGRKHLHEGRILKPVRTNGGYLQVTLYRNGKKRKFLVHRMVAETWLGKPDGKTEVNHIDEDKTNNSVWNLEWVSHGENINFGTRNKRVADSQSIPVEALDPDTGEVVLEFPSTMEAGRKGFNQSTVSACCLGKQRTHKGLVWRYKDDYGQENAWTPVKIGAASRLNDRRPKAVLAIDPETGKVVREFPSACEAGRSGFSQAHVSDCCLGKRRTHRGLIWCYKES